MIAILNKSKTALTINRQEFKLALGKIGAGIDKQIASLKKAKQSYDAAEMAREVISEANIFEASIEGFNEAEETNLKLTDITNLEVAQGWVDEFLEKKVKQVLNLEDIKIEKKRSFIRLSFDFSSEDEINQWLKKLRK